MLIFCFVEAGRLKPDSYFSPFSPSYMDNIFPLSVGRTYQRYVESAHGPRDHNYNRAEEISSLSF